jgi:hypothetical protein
MKTIYKYPIEVTDTQFIEMPEGAKILTVKNQLDVGPCLWAEVETDNPVSFRRIEIYGTGNPMHVQESASESIYIGTFMQRQDRLVWHVYEIKKKEII